MKKRALPFLVCYLSMQAAFAQYCMLPGRTPYSTLQPGITNFQLNTINRTSGNSESATSVVVATGLSTTLTAGQTYTISMSHSEDTQFFIGDRNNLRVWIDYNSNFSYTDAGETVLLKDLEAPATTYTATFTVPLSTPPGTTFLRATAKMSSDAGHTLPTSCDIPADPLGYHGEMEDYTVVIENPGFPQSSFLLSSTVCIAAAVSPTNNSTGNPAPTYSWSSNPAAGVTFSPNNAASNPQITFSAAGNYTIICKAINAVSSHSSSEIIAVSNCNLVGIAENNSFSTIKMGPNPLNDLFYLQLPTTEDIIEVTIVNYTGGIRYQKNISGSSGFASLDLRDLENGVYTIIVKSGTQRMNRQIIVAK